jgi:hypothetical protein
MTTHEMCEAARAEGFASAREKCAEVVHLLAQQEVDKHIRFSLELAASAIRAVEP